MLEGQEDERGRAKTNRGLWINTENTFKLSDCNKITDITLQNVSGREGVQEEGPAMAALGKTRTGSSRDAQGLALGRASGFRRKERKEHGKDKAFHR